MSLTGDELPAPSDLSEILQAGLAANPGAVALISMRQHFTWQQLDETTNRLASGYLDLGLQPGDRIASLMPNRPASVIHYLACLKAGLVATPLNYRYTPPEIDHALEVSGASLLLHHQERAQDVVASRRSHDLPKGVLSYSAEKDSAYQLLITQGNPKASFAKPEANAPACIFFTSGSTGLPKGVTHTRHSIGWVLASIASAFQLTAGDVLLPGSSFSHMAASMFGLASLASGARLAVPHGSHTDELLPLMRTARPTVMFMLPAALVMLVRDHGTVKEDFASIRVCFAGGDKVSSELEQEYTELVGCPVDEGYGMTEIGHAATLPPGAPFRQGSIGMPCPGYEFSIRSDVGAELPPGSEGRVWVRFPGNMIGYWNNPEATAETIVDGWLDTGDVMIADDDGYLWFHGRKKQIIVHDGSNICPEEVEDAIAAHPAVDAAGVVGVHDLVHGEIVRAYVTLKADSPQPTAAELIQFARQRIGYKAPEEIVFLDQMPRNAAGKTDRTTLKQIAEDRIASSIRRVNL